MSCKQAVSFLFSAITLFASGSALANGNSCPCPYIVSPVCGENHEIFDNECLASCNSTPVFDDGALIEYIDRDGTYYSFFSKDDAFIDEALDVMNGLAVERVPFFLDLHWNNVCTSGYNFMPDHHDMEWRDVADPACDATVDDVDGDKHQWVDINDEWCPSGGQLYGVWDQRPPTP